MAEKKKKSHSSFGTLFWIAFILLIIILFVYNKDSIFSGISKIGTSGLFSHEKKVELNGDSAEPITPKVTTDNGTTATGGSEDARGDGSLAPERTTSTEATIAKEPAKPETVKTEHAENVAKEPATSPATKETPVQKTNPAPNALLAPAKKTSQPTQAKTTANPIKKTKTPPSETAKTEQGRTAKLYFVTIDDDGKVIRREVARAIPQNDSPLTETLQALFRGPNAAESKKKLMTCIPPGTKLLSTTVKNGVAIINVSDEFQFNQYGIEGCLGQLAQIVFTATAFPTVQSVQILIDGQRRDYLGAEGVWIGAPLTRAKFN